MPNWAYTQYHCDGDKEQLKQLHSIMEELKSMKAPGLHENGFSQTWLGNLVIKLGGEWDKIYCRGSWENLLLHDDGTVSFSAESAWDEPNEVRVFIEKKFSNIHLYYQTEECGEGIYKTNDSTGKYFPEKYYLWVECEETEYYDSLDKLIKEVQSITGSKNLKTFESCVEALESYSQQNDDLGYSLEEFSIIND